MINILKMDFYRMMHTKVAWIILVITMMFAGFSMYMGKVEGVESYDNSNKVEIREESVDMNFGIFVNTPQSVDGTQPALLEYIQADLQSGILMIFIAIFAALFVHAERKNGYIKNIGRLHKHKSMLVISKIGIVILYLVIVVSAYALVQIVYGSFLYPDASLGLTASRLAYIGVQFLLMAAFSVLIIFITVLFKQSDISIAFGILSACGIGYLITEVINKKITMNGFDLNHYFLVGTINRISSQSNSNILSHALLVGISWLIIWSTLTILVSERRDVMQFMLLGISIGINIILIGILVIYRRQISSICRQIAYIRKNETNMLITSEVSFGEIKKVVEEINKLNEEGKEIVARYMEKDAVLRQTITSLSHDIRTPLTSMDGYLQLLELEQEPEKLKQYIDVIMGRVKILKEILEELFLYTKLQDREYQLELQKENMTQIVFESVTAFYEEFKQNKMEPNISFPEEELEVVCHKGMMERVIQNIVKNSIIHGVSFVEIDLVKKNGQAVLRCKNDMKDASDINMELIFERFYKADISRSKSSSGLGLAITKELVEKMNGTIEANRIENMFQIEVRFDLLQEEVDEHQRLEGLNY